MAVHDGCTASPFTNLGKQAPMATVDLYNTTVLDTYVLDPNTGNVFFFLHVRVFQGLSASARGGAPHDRPPSSQTCAR